MVTDRTRAPAGAAAKSSHLYQPQPVRNDGLESFGALVGVVFELVIDFEDLQDDLHLELRTFHNALARAQTSALSCSSPTIDSSFGFVLNVDIADYPTVAHDDA